MRGRSVTLRLYSCFEILRLTKGTQHHTILHGSRYQVRWRVADGSLNLDRLDPPTCEYDGTAAAFLAIEKSSRFQGGKRGLCKRDGRRTYYSEILAQKKKDGRVGEVPGTVREAGLTARHHYVPRYLQHTHRTRPMNLQA